MMKMIFRIYKWILLSVFLQLLLLLFINNVYLNGRDGPVKVTSAEVTGGQEKPKKDTKVRISDKAEQISVSFDGLYLSYVVDNKLEIMDLKSKKVKKSIAIKDGETLTFYRWLPDRNMIMYAVKGTEGQTGWVQITTHDIDTDIETSYPQISKISKQSQVVDIEFSVLTRVSYVKVKTSDTQATVYKYNIMGNLSYVMAINSQTVLKEANYVDKLVYQNEKNKLFVRDGSKNVTWSFPFKNKMVLLGIDSEDNVYAGELNKDGKVAQIHYGKLSVEPDKAWQQISLKQPAAAEDLVVTPDQKIYMVEKATKKVYNVKSNDSIQFKGEYVEIISGYAASLDDGELKLTVLK